MKKIFAICLILGIIPAIIVWLGFDAWCLTLGIIWGIIALFVWFGVKDEKMIAKDSSWKIFRYAAIFLTITAATFIAAYFIP
jgi:hypothetical protein